jgi:hypothetical protein
MTATGSLNCTGTAIGRLMVRVHPGEPSQFGEVNVGRFSTSAGLNRTFNRYWIIRALPEQPRCGDFIREQFFDAACDPFSEPQVGLGPVALPGTQSCDVHSDHFCHPLLAHFGDVSPHFPDPVAPRPCGADVAGVSVGGHWADVTDNRAGLQSSADSRRAGKKFGERS